MLIKKGDGRVQSDMPTDLDITTLSIENFTVDLDKRNSDTITREFPIAMVYLFERILLCVKLCQNARLT